MGEKRRFRNEDEERDYWAEHDSTEHVDWSRAERVTLPRLKPSVKSISLRLPQSMLDQLRILANKRDVPYQSLIEVFLAERLRKELEDGPPHGGAFLPGAGYGSRPASRRARSRSSPRPSRAAVSARSPRSRDSAWTARRPTTSRH